MKAKEAHDLSDDELRLRLDGLKEAHMKLRFQHATAQLDNANTIRAARKDIARVMTVLNERRNKSAAATAQG